MPVASFTDKNTWWSELRQNGLLISPPLMEELLPEGPERPSYRRYQQLRDAYTKFIAWLESHNRQLSGDVEPLHQWLTVVLEDYLGHDSNRWDKGSNVPMDYSVESIDGERLRPSRVLYDSPEKKNPRLFVSFDKSNRVGMGKGRTEYGKFLELLRGNNQKLGLITNGSQFRLCYAGIDHDAWVEWEIDDWFDQEDLRARLDGFYSLLGPDSINRSNGVAYPLLHAVEESRTRQGDLSAVLGEQVREAVEEIIYAVEDAARKEPDLLNAVRFTPEGHELSDKEWLSALYQGASRIIMRMVVILFAEAKGMLPRDIHYYNESYGLEGLFESLQSALRHEGKLQLHEHHTAWSRLKSLFTLIYSGSPHSEITVPSYGGLLFRPGNPDSNDPVIRAISIFEDPRIRVSDYTVFEILQKLKIGTVKVKRGRSNTWASGPVDFGQLRTEYIGIIYEGLLDYELRRAKDEEPIVFLNMGTEPILPLPLLEEMPDKQLKELISDLKKEKTEGPDIDLDEVLEDAEEAETEEVDGSEDDEADETDEEPEDEEESLTRDEQLQQRAHAWAMRAVEVAGLVSRRKNEDDYYYEQRKAKEARNLLKQVVDSRGFYLSTSGGTRKGTGTFYTKPQLTVPTAQRTLKPLLYDEIEERLSPKTPDEILSIKVCDPACGSGSFLVAALDYITDALFKSVRKHAEIREYNESSVITLPRGEKSSALLQEETVSLPPTDERFEEMLRSKLKRHVVERCIYGVDMNPLAVELCKLSLWVETMDPQLPFGFLDHKIKTGNSLVGCWFDYFQDYPIMAWDRDSGDSTHSNGVHFKKGEWSKNIKRTLKERVKPEIRELITRQKELFKRSDVMSPAKIHNEALEVFQKLHELPMSANGIEKRERLYREKIRNNPDYQRLKDAFDLWCAVWFWPADSLGEEAPTPNNFFQPREDTWEIAGQVARDMRFFHWELEFPDVFVGEESGFSAMLGNPPWEILKPNSKEFFSWYDPLYRARGKQEALDEQTRLFDTNNRIERDWLQYNSTFKGYSNWVKNATNPWGYHDRNSEEESPFNLMDKGAQWRDSDKLHHLWKDQRKKRLTLSSKEHPYRYQGSADRNSYKMFLEYVHSLTRTGGRFGMIVPSGIYTDHGTSDLRQLFLDKSKWEWLFGFENKRAIFDIHRSFKFCPVIIEKGSETQNIQTSFMNHDPAAWEDAEKFSVPYPKDQVDQFSPNSKALLEIRTHRDLEILEKIYDGSVLLGDQSDEGWQIQYNREFDMTNDSKLFIPRPKAEEQGYRPDIYGRWLKGNWQDGQPDGLRCRAAGEYVNVAEGVIPARDGQAHILESGIESELIPLYVAKMINNYDFSDKGWVSGKGRGANWQIISNPKVLDPEYLMDIVDYNNNKNAVRSEKVAFKDITTAVHQRTMIASLIPDFPCVHSIPVLHSNIGFVLSRGLLSTINSFAYDFVCKQKISYLHLTYFMLGETPLPPLNQINKKVFYLTQLLSLSLSSQHLEFMPFWLKTNLILANELNRFNVHKLFALTRYERLRYTVILQSVVAELYSVSYSDYAYMLNINKNNPKGFWRVDQDKPLELRQTTLTLAAFRDLKEMGLEAFLNIEDPDGLPGCGWQIPEELTVNVNRDSIIEFDTAAGKTEKVRERLGPRFYPWQLEQSPEESWEECHIHARNILGKEKYDRLIAQLENGEEPTDGSDIKVGGPGQEDLFDKDSQIRLF